MKTSEQIGQLAAALAKAQASMKGAVKDAKNPFFKSTYADLSSVIQAISEPFSEHGLAYTQGTGFQDGMIVVTTRIMHESGEWIESDTLLPPTKDDAQGYGSAITYGRRYGLQALAGVPTADDDGNAAVQHKKERINRPQAQEYIKSLETLIESEDGIGLRQFNDELKQNEALHRFVWDYFSTDQKTKAKSLIHSVRDGQD